MFNFSYHFELHLTILIGIIPVWHHSSHVKNDLHDVVFPEVSVVAIAVICAQSPQEGCALFLLGNLL